MLKPKENNSLDIKDIIFIIRHRKWLIIIPLIVVTAIAYGGTFFLEPKFQANTIIWIDKPSSSSTELDRLLGGSNRRESRDEQQSRRRGLETEIKSSIYLSQLIRNLKLDNDPEISREAAIKREDNPDLSLEEIKENLLIGKLSKQIIVSFQGMDQINITCDALSPTLARDMANQLAEIFKVEKTRYETEKILDNQNFTDAQLERMEQHHKSAIDSLNSARSRLTKLQLPENIASEENRLAIISSIDKTELDQNDYDREINSHRSKLKENDLADLRLKFTDTIIELRTTIDGLISDYASMMERYSWNDQNVINVNIRLNDNIKLLEYSLTSTIKAQFSSFPEDQIEMLSKYFIAHENYDILFSKKKKLTQILENIDQRMNQIPRLESEINELQGRVDNYAQLRDVFRSEEATVDILSEQMKDRTKYKIIEAAKLPLDPYWPNNSRIILIGFALGLMLAGGFVFLAEVLDKSYKKIEDIEEELGLKVIATIPKIEKYNMIR